jgi:hypothetical protein
MRLSSRILVTLPCLILACAIVCVGQAEEGVHGHIFRHNEIGLTYTFPERFSPKVESEIHPQDPSGREHVFLALWDTPERTGVPRMAFLYDRKIRPADRSREEMADRYLAEVRQMWVNVPGVRISGPKKISPAGYAIWRLDLWQPDTLPHYNSAIVIPLADRRLLLIQVNAPSQSELDAEVDSLRELHLDSK